MVEPFTNLSNWLKFKALFPLHVCELKLHYFSFFCIWSNESYILSLYNAKYINLVKIRMIFPSLIIIISTPFCKPILTTKSTGSKSVQSTFEGEWGKRLLCPNRCISKVVFSSSFLKKCGVRVGSCKSHSVPASICKSLC